MYGPPANIGDPICAVDTPALVIDLDAYERNLDRMAQWLAGKPVRLRAHAKTHKSPIIAQHQIERGAVGVCCQKVGEAEALVAGGVLDVFVSNQIVGASKLARLAALARQAKISVCVDDPANVRDLAAAARAVDVRLPVLVEVDIGAGRCGVAPGAATVNLARVVAEFAELKFAGIHAYQGRAQHVYDRNERREVMSSAIELARQTVAALNAAHLPCEIVTGAGTGTYEFESASGVYNEIQAGSYVFMDVDYRRVRGTSEQFENALFVLAGVMSRPTADRAVCDAGLKAHSIDSGLPTVRNRTDIEYTGASDEHGTLRLHDPNTALALGDQLWLIPGHCDPTVNLYDWFVGVRGDHVESIWPIAARGAVR